MKRGIIEDVSVRQLSDMHTLGIRASWKPPTKPSLRILKELVPNVQDVQVSREVIANGNRFTAGDVVIFQRHGRHHCGELLMLTLCSNEELALVTQWAPAGGLHPDARTQKFIVPACREPFFVSMDSLHTSVVYTKEAAAIVILPHGVQAIA